MKLIDADEIRWTNLEDGFGRIKECIAFATDIDAMQAVEIVRCKDCKYRDDLQFSPVTIHLCARFNKFATHTIDDLERFCSWGERKE